MYVVHREGGEEIISSTGAGKSVAPSETVSMILAWSKDAVRDDTHSDLALEVNKEEGHKGRALHELGPRRGRQGRLYMGAAH